MCGGSAAQVLSRQGWHCSVARQEKMMRNGTTLLLVVGFAGRFQPGFIDHSTRPVGGPSVRSAGTIRWFGLRAVQPSCRRGLPTERRSWHLGTCRSTGTLLPGWIGFGLGAASGCTGEREPVSSAYTLPGFGRRPGQDTSDPALLERDDRRRTVCRWRSVRL